jgi:RNA polymerase sigma factor (sigma-70 family)
MSARNDDLFEKTVAPYILALLRVATLYIGTEEAEDIVQETLTHAWLSFATLRDKALAFPWLTKITINVCKDWLRGRFGTERRHRIMLNEQLLPLLPLQETIGTNDHTAILDLRAAVNALDEEIRLLVLLRYYIGMNASEIEEVTGIAASTVRTRLSRALLRLQKLLEPASSNCSQQEVSHE